MRGEQLTTGRMTRLDFIAIPIVVLVKDFSRATHSCFARWLIAIICNGHIKFANPTSLSQLQSMEFSDRHLYASTPECVITATSSPDKRCIESSEASHDQGKMLLVHVAFGL
jgi:hypothetical protein